MDSLHVLARIRGHLARLLESCDDRKSIQYTLIKYALSLIEFGPLSSAGFFCLYDDTPASFMQIIREFKIMCNTRIKIQTTATGPF